MQLSGCNEPKTASTAVEVAGGRCGTQVTHRRVILGAGWTGPCTTSELSHSLEGHPEQGRISALNPRRTRKARAAGGCQLTTAALSSRPAWRGSASPRRGPTLISRASLPCMLMTSLWELNAWEKSLQDFSNMLG